MSADVTYASGTSFEVIAAASAYLANEFNWSDAAEQQWQAARLRAAAKLLLTSMEPMVIAVRASCFALMLSVQEARAKVNQIIAAVQAGDVSAVQPLLTGDSLATALEQIADIIDSGAV